jgi:hypothetical protein
MQSGYINPASVHVHNFALSNAFGTVAQAWPTSPDLDPLSWVTDNENAGAAYSPSSVSLPVFSAGIFTADDESSWTYFNPQFTSQSQISSSSNTAAAINLTKERLQTPNVACFDFPILPAPPASMIQTKDDNCDPMGDIVPLNKPSVSSKIRGESPRKNPKASWGKSKNIPQSRKPDRQTSRVKRGPEPSNRRQPFRSNSSSGPQLRGIKNRPQMEPEKGAEEEEDSGRLPPTRVTHNMIEKQYRTRLNIQFTNLLEAIPQEVIGTQFDDYDDAGGRKGKVSKGDVLALAKRYIQTLEQDKQSLERENKEYKQSISHLRAALSRN